MYKDTYSVSQQYVELNSPYETEFNYTSESSLFGQICVNKEFDSSRYSQ